MKRLMCVALVAVLCSGCFARSLNVQRAGLRSTGDISVTILGDATDDSEVTVVIAEVKAIAQELLAFMNTGNVWSLTKGQLEAKVVGMVPSKHRALVDDLLGLVDVVNVDVHAIGTGNVKRIKAFLRGTIRGCDRYDKADREE